MQTRQTRRALAAWCSALCAMALVVVVAGPVDAQRRGDTVQAPGLPGLESGEWRAAHVGDVGGDPDLPVLLIARTDVQDASRLLVGLDARNGTDGYSLSRDPVIFVAVMDGAAAVQTVYYDIGFAEDQSPSGQFRQLVDPDPDALPDFLTSIVPVPEQADAAPGESSQTA